MSEAHEVTIGKVDFAAGDPCRPRYVDLYHDQEAWDDPRVQVEPAFQVGHSVDELRVRVELKGKDVEFTDEDGRPLCRELNDPEIRPQIEYDGPSACILTWSRGHAVAVPTRVFRIYCHRGGGQKPTDEEMVYGGIFLAVTTSMSEIQRHIPHQHPAQVKLQNIVVLGTDYHGRPVYDVFKKRELLEPKGVELAPAFRARGGMPLEFSMIMGIEEACWNGQVEYIQPRGKQPPHLQGTYDPLSPKTYHFLWQAPDQGCVASKPLESCYLGEIVTFHLKPELLLPSPQPELPSWLAHAGFTSWEDFAAAVKRINVDPTIIQPPPCDPVYRVCAD